MLRNGMGAVGANWAVKTALRLTVLSIPLPPMRAAMFMQWVVSQMVTGSSMLRNGMGAVGARWAVRTTQR